MTFLYKVLTAIGAFIVGGFVLLFLISRHDKKLVEEFKAAQKVHVADSIETNLAPQSDSLRTVFVNQKVPYIVYRDRVIQEHPTDTVIKTLAGKCDQLIITCEQRQRVDSVRIANLQGEVKTLKAIKEKKPPRASGFVLGGYDWYNAQPLAQVGGDFRIVGPLSVTGFVEGSRSIESGSKLETRGVVGARFTFR